jgi:alkanesulfonate monooxygenase SsuD/methylene tetrahydromethanopterin reductase-like flavin-dependent oxidoreductase (luciferase family)
MLRLAAREADIVALGVGPDATEDQVAERVDWIREAAGKRFDHMELNVHLMAVAGQLPRYLRMILGDRAPALAESDAIPVLKGTVEQMSDRLEWLRERFGISYIMVSDELMEALAPVVERLAGR